jgi:hypothetical protein
VKLIETELAVTNDLLILLQKFDSKFGLLPEIIEKIMDTVILVLENPESTLTGLTLSSSHFKAKI